MKKRVLIVDDSLTVRMDLSEAFEASDFELHVAGDLAEARLVLADKPFDVVVLDVLLPDGDGLTMLSELRGNERTSSIPVMMLSTEAEVRDRVRGLSSGADEYVGKPYDTANVTARAWELVNRGSAAKATQGNPHVLVIESTYAFGLARRQASRSRLRRHGGRGRG